MLDACRLILGANAAKEGRLPEAVARFEQALELCNDCRFRGDLLKGLGLAYCHAGELEKGKRMLRDALKLRPRDEDIHAALQMAQERGR